MITIFVGTTDRLTTLQRTIASYRKFRTPHEIVIVDNGTEHPACVKVLDRLEKKVKRIYRLPGCNDMDEAQSNFNLAIRDQYDSGDAGEWFAVSEADVCFEGTNPKALAKYLLLAKETGRPVGSHLRVDANIPAHYPLRSRVLACETWMLYRDQMQWLDDIPFSDTQIDTTFHLFPATRHFNRLHMGPLRVGPPYDAMHLDWYLNIFKPVPENAIYIAGRREVGSWGKAWIRDYWFAFQERGAEAAFAELMAAPLNDHGDLCNVSFMRSWAYQYGVGVEADREQSERWLYDAIPAKDERYYWPLEEFWTEMIFDSNFSGLGWDA